MTAALEAERDDAHAGRRWLVAVAPTAAEQQRLVASYGIPEERRRGASPQALDLK